MKTTKMLTYLVAALGMMAATAMADSAKAYRVNLPEANIGSAVLPSGEYSMRIDGTAVRLTEIKTGKVMEVTAKVGSLEDKVSRTEVHSQKIDGVTKISEIRLGGTRIRVDFREQTTP